MPAYFSGKITGGTCCLLQTALAGLLVQGQSSLRTSFRQKKGTKEGEGYLRALGQRLGFGSSLCESQWPFVFRSPDFQG